jgi:hypothetical protein
MIFLNYNFDFCRLAESMSHITIGYIDTIMLRALFNPEILFSFENQADSRYLIMAIK